MDLACVNCQTVNSNDSRFCEECGTIIKKSIIPQYDKESNIDNSINTDYNDAQNPTTDKINKGGNKIKDPYLGFLLSLIIPGFSFFMVSKIYIGILIFFFTILLLNTDSLILLGGLTYIIQLWLGMNEVKQHNLSLN